MNNNILTIERDEPGAGDASALPVKKPAVYPLDWDTTTVRLKEGRFAHTLRRPTPAEIFERDAELQSDIPIAKDGSFSMPDPTASEDVDAKYYDRLLVGADGYSSDVPASHKAAAFQGLYMREIYIDDEADPFADEVRVIEEIGQGDEPDWTIVHVMRQPTESELKRYRRRSSQGEIKPGKRGKQRFVSRSTLKNSVEHYDLWVQNVLGVRLDKTPDADVPARVATVDPLIKKQVVGVLVDAIAGSLLD